MMSWVLHNDRIAFAGYVTPFLAQREAANNLQLGMVARFAKGQAGSHRSDDSTQPLMLTCQRNGEIRSVAIRTPPFPIVLTHLADGEVESLADYLAAMGDHAGKNLAGCVGPAESSRALAQLWSRRFELPLRLHHTVRAYELTRVVPPNPAEGSMQRATIDDLALVERWIGEFSREIHEPIAAAGNPAQRHITDGRLFLWRDANGETVSMAALGADTPNGCRVNLVYTPHEQRGRGYASNLVAQMSQHALDSGRKFCFLFADTANPTASGIYQRMGYRPVVTYENYRFDGHA